MARPMLRLLSDEEVGRMKAEVIRVLEDFGVEITHGEAQKVLTLLS